MTINCNNYKLDTNKVTVCVCVCVLETHVSLR